MAYKHFTLARVRARLGVTAEPGNLFPALTPATVPGWLADILALGTELPLVSEKARCEYIVAPILLAVRQAAAKSVSILSGQALNVDPDRQLEGVCDFLIARSPPVPELRAPLMAIVEAKRNLIERGLGQCIAQMVAARIFNERAGSPVATVYGCVTSGENWQFLGLTGDTAVLHRPRYYISDLGNILAAFHHVVAV